MNLNPEYFNDLSLAELLKMLRNGKSFENDMGLMLSRQPVERQIEVATRVRSGKAVHGWFPMTQQGLEDAILVGFAEIEDDSDNLIGWQVYSYGETYKRMSDEVLTLKEALADLKEAEIEASDQEWSLLPVYAGEIPHISMVAQQARA